MQERDQDSSKPAIPNLKEPPRPQVKIKGLSTAQTTLVERLKAFKKKDLAFILAGLGVLFMAPLAEHFLMSPETGESGAFKEGWGFRGGGEFGKGGSPYEGGLSGLAPGTVAGSGSDVITPLNVRDPSSLVMGPGATQQPPTSASPAKETADWKDALSNSASKSAQTAGRSAGLPAPRIPLTNAGVRGLGVASGGSGASYTLPPISAANVPNRAAESSSPNPRAAAGYRGAAHGPQSASTSGYEALKKAAATAGGDFNRAGSASSDLQTAAGRDMNQPTSGLGGAGEGGSGAPDKAGGGNQNKDAKTEGESLAFLKAKTNQEKELELYWKKRDMKEMMWPELQKKLLESMVTKMGEKVTDAATGVVADWFKGSAAKSFTCVPWDQKDLPLGKASVATVSDNDISSCTGQAPGKDDTGTKYYAMGDDRQSLYFSRDCKAPANLWCTGKAEPTPTGPSGASGKLAESAIVSTAFASKLSAQYSSSFKTMCEESKNLLDADKRKGDQTVNPVSPDISGSPPNVQNNFLRVAQTYPRAINLLMGAKRAMDGTQGAQDCVEPLKGKDQALLKKIQVKSEEGNIRSTLVRTNTDLFGQSGGGESGVFQVLDHSLLHAQNAVGLLKSQSGGEGSAAAAYLPPAVSIKGVMDKILAASTGEAGETGSTEQA